MPDSVKILDTKKYLWDGETYESKPAAEEAEGKYKSENFETRLLEEEGKFLVYTRRVVTEVVVEGAPPA